MVLKRKRNLIEKIMKEKEIKKLPLENEKDLKTKEIMRKFSKLVSVDS